MTNKSELQNLEKRKEQLEKAIEYTKQKKEQIVLIVQNFVKELNSGKITRNESEEKLSQALKNRSAEQWLKYYDDYIKYYDYQIKSCEKLIKQEETKKIKTLPVLKLLILIFSIILIISLIFILKPFFIKETEESASQILPEKPKIILEQAKEQAKILEETFAQLSVVIGKPVKWQLEFNLDTPSSFNTKLPPNSELISIKNKQNQEIKAEANEELIGKEINVKVIEKSKKFKIIYETPAPEIKEEVIGENKKLVITAPIAYSNIFSQTELPDELSKEELRKLKLYQIKNNQKKEIKFTAYDTNENSLFDFIEFIAPETGEYELVIEISKAEHLDENRENGVDIYEQVKALDNNWSETINNNEYVRVTFQQKLDKTRDITIYPRIVSGNPRIEVYEINKNEKIAEFININNNTYNKVYLTNLPENYYQDVFDLRVINGSIEIEHIIDPVLNIRSGIGTTNTGGTATISFTTNMPSSSYSVLMSGQTDTDTMYSMTYLNKANTGFSVKAEDDSGANEAGNFEWMAVEFGDYIFGSNAIKCGAGPGGGGTINFPSFFLNTNYAVMVNSIDDSDSPLVNFVAGSKTTVSFQIDIEDDTGANESVTTTNYCAFTIGEYSLNNVKIKAGTSATSTSGDTIITFSSSFSSTNYVVMAMAQAVNTNLCAPEIVIKNIGSFTIHFENDVGANCASRNFDWIAVELGEFIIDTIPPIVNLSSPENSTTTSLSKVWFAANFTDNNLKNTTLYVWNSTGSIINNTENRTITGIFNSTNISITLPYEGTFYWNYYTCDNSSNCDFAENNYTFKIDSNADTTAPSVKLNTPEDESITAQSLIKFNCSAVDDKNLLNATLYFKTKTIIKTLYFREDGTFINKTEDTQLNADSPNTNYGSLGNINVDRQNPHAHGVIKFPNIFGNTENQIPLGAKILSANLTLSISNSGNNMQAYRLKENWTEAETTWNNRFVGSAWATPGADIPDSADNSYYEIFSAPIGIQTYSITKFMQNWSDGLPNYGIVLTDTGNNGIDFYSSESSTNQKPLLAVTYEYTEILWHANQTQNFSGTENESIFIINLEKNADYEWNCLVYDLAGNANWSNSNYTFTKFNQPLQIEYIESISPQMPIENSIETITFEVRVSDPDGVNDINDNSVTAEFSKPGEITRTGACLWQSDIPPNTASYLCSVDMQYYDGAGIWNIKISARDNSNNLAEDTSRSFIYQELKAMTISPATISWPPIIQGAINQIPLEFTTITNTGNYEGQIIIRAQNIYGQPRVSEFIPANSFTAGTTTGTLEECNAPVTATTLQDNSDASIINSMLNNGATAQEEIFYCIPQVPQISSQIYSTSGGTPWTIILMVSITLRKRKKNKKKQKSQRKHKTEIINDNLIISLNLLSKEIKQEYSKEKQEIIILLAKEIKKKYKLNNQEIVQLIETEKQEIPLSIFKYDSGALESICRYMKENLNMRYKEISDLLQRNERTIWVAYNKAKQKQPETIKIEQEKILIPISIFNKKLTILESIILFLKSRQMKYIEIANLLNRDQRNIWTIYSRAIKK